MDTAEAVALIEGAVRGTGGSAWADIGAGDGTFTRALVQLRGARARIYAVDRDARAIAALDRWAKRNAASVVPVVADFSRPFELPGPDVPPLDGVLFANALHYVSDPGAVIARLGRWLRPGGRVVIVEYDRRRANRWVPYPIDAERLPALTAAAGLTAPVITATRPSAYGGEIYVAIADRPAEA